MDEVEFHQRIKKAVAEELLGWAKFNKSKGKFEAAANCLQKAINELQEIANEREDEDA